MQTYRLNTYLSNLIRSVVCVSSLIWPSVLILYFISFCYLKQLQQSLKEPHEYLQQHFLNRQIPVSYKYMNRSSLTRSVHILDLTQTVFKLVIKSVCTPSSQLTSDRLTGKAITVILYPSSKKNSIFFSFELVKNNSHNRQRKTITEQC